MRRTAPVIATLSAVALTLTACSSGSGSGGAEPDDGGPITLDYWAWGTAQQPMVDAWNATHPDIPSR